MQLYKLVEEGEGFFRDRGSKFYSFAYPAENLQTVEQHLVGLRRRFHDARHHCYAYRLGIKGDISYASDDREPSNSAGPPILAAIRAHNLTQTVIVVVRYFGGTKLGIRGLIEAYRAASEDALAHAQKIIIVPTQQLQIDYSYPQTSEINRLLHHFGLVPVQAEYTDRCKIILDVPEKNLEAVSHSFIQAGFHLIQLSD